MRIAVAKYSGLGRVDALEAKRKALGVALGMELGILGLCASLVGEHALPSMTKSVQVVGESRAVALPTVDSVKTYLAQKWMVPADTPALTETAGRIVSFFHTGLPDADLGWMELFQHVDLRTSNQDSFDVIDTSSALTWQQVKPGGKVEIRRNISESKTTVGYLTDMAGIGLLDDWLRFNKFWNIEQVIMEFREKAFARLATRHYGLFTALGAGIDVAFSVDATQTFNNAAASMLRALDAKGYAIGQSAVFNIVCAPEKVGYILKMLEATQGSLVVGYNQNAQPIAYRVGKVIATPKVAANDTGYYLVLPGRKLQRATWMDLSVTGVRDEYTRAEDWIGTMQYNATIGDSDQVRRVKYA